VPTNNRFHGLANAVEGSVIGYDTSGTPYSGVPDSNAPGGMRWYSLDFADTNAFRASQAADLLATGRGGGNTNESLPPVENLYRPFEGHVASSYRTAVDGMMNPNASWDERLINGTLATLVSPLAVVDMMGEGFMNAPNAAGRAGQWFAQANVTTNPDTRVTAALSGIVEMTNAFNGAVGPFAGAVGVPQRVMTVEELSLQRFQGAEATRAARATYSGLGDNGGLYTSTKPLGDVFPELVGVNVHYVPGAPPGTNVNCFSCANAAQARLSGLDLEATALPSTRYGGMADLYPSAPLGFQPPTIVAAIEQQMLAAGNGAYGLVLIGPEGATQHVINVVNRDGIIYFVDTQLGRIVTLPPNVEVRLGMPL
jgi:Papain fold toxin 1, glutamine deamidase